MSDGERSHPKKIIYDIVSRRPPGAAGLTPPAVRRSEATELHADSDRRPAAELDKVAENFFLRKDKENEKEEAENRRFNPAKSALFAVPKDNPIKPLGRSRAFWLWSGGAAGMLIAASFLVSTVFARLAVVILPEVSDAPISQPLLIKVSPDISAVDPARAMIPGELIEMQSAKTIEVPTTGKKLIVERAKGVVVITNAFSVSPQVLVTGTRLIAEDGKLFLLEKGVTVPGARSKNGELIPASIEAAAVAAVAGEAYNLPTAILHIAAYKGTPKYAGFGVKAKSGFSGGYNGEANLATDADIRAASEQATRMLYENLKNSLSLKIPAGFIAPEGSREIEVTDVDAPRFAAGNEKVTVTARGRVRAIIFRPADEAEVAAAHFSASTPKMVIMAGSKFERRSIALDLKNRELTYTLTGTARLSARLDGEAVRREIAGKSLAEIESRLRSQAGIASFTLKVFPFWLQSSPKNDRKIGVSVSD